MANDFTRRVKANQAYFGITNKKMAKMLGVTEKTLGKHINEPGTMSVYELRSIVKILKLDEDAIRELVLR